MPAVSPGTMGLVSWWALGEASGTRNDSHSTNHLTPVATPGSATGKVGNALSLVSASDQYLTIPAASQTGLGSAGSFAFGLWLKPTAYSATNTTFICSKRDGSAAEFTMTTSAGSAILHFYLATGFSPQISGAFAADTWMFVVVGYNAATGNSCISINGAAPATAARTYAGTASAPFSIGYDLSGGLPKWDGLIDEAFYYTRWLTDDELTWLYNSGSGRTYTDLTAQSIVPHLAAHTDWWSR